MVATELRRIGRAALRWLPARSMRWATVAAVLAWAALACFGPWGAQGMAPGSFDWMQKHRLWASAPDPRVLIVDIDERSLAEMAGEFGRWPWPRDTLATLLAHAERQGAAAIVFDILFADPDRLSPGGDRALDLAVAASRRSVFPMLRLPAANDAVSEFRVDQVPGLALPPPTPGPAPRLAVVLPFMKSMLDSGRLGAQTARLDDDGLLRRHAWAEALPGGWMLPSLPWVVASTLGAAPAPDAVAHPVVWRRRADAYPSVPFALAWACADGSRQEGCPELRGRVLVIGASAPALHDLRSTPLAVNHHGVDILATLIDNALHRRQLVELGAGARFALTVAAIALALAVVRHAGIVGTSRALVGLPLALLLLGYASLHSERVFLDLSLPAAAVLAMLAAIRFYDAARRWLLAQSEEPAMGSHALWVSAPHPASEDIERAVLDAAARCGGTTSGWLEACPGALLPPVWVLWDLPDAALAGAVRERLARRAPGLRGGSFVIDAAAEACLQRALSAAAAGAPK